jgi:hypothetical protein
MGQYWYPVNLDKHEFISPHVLGCGLKLAEQVGTFPGTGTALILLCAASPERRGGGDVEPSKVLGRWAGDRIALVGDYAEDGDLPAEFQASTIMKRCRDEEYKYTEKNIPGPRYTDISEMVAVAIEKELEGKFSGTGWRTFKFDGEEETREALRPDMILTSKKR